MKYVHIKLELVAQVTDEQANRLLDSNNGDEAVDNLLHEWNHGDATLTTRERHREKDGVAAVDWLDR